MILIHDVFGCAVVHERRLPALEGQQFGFEPDGPLGLRRHLVGGGFPYQPFAPVRQPLGSHPVKQGEAHRVLPGQLRGQRVEFALLWVHDLR